MPDKPNTFKPKGKAKSAPKKRDETQAHRKLLRTRGYGRFRKMVIADRPLCEDCDTEQSTDVHHTRGLADHPQDLCDASQVMALCHSCHSKRTARGE